MNNYWLKRSQERHLRQRSQAVELIDKVTYYYHELAQDPDLRAALASDWLEMAVASDLGGLPVWRDCGRHRLVHVEAFVDAVLNAIRHDAQMPSAHLKLTWASEFMEYWLLRSK